MPTRVYTGVSQPDVASLTYNGVHYRCFVWKDRSTQTVRSAIRIEQQAGQDVPFHEETLHTAIDTGLWWTPDTPKVIAVGSTFICHWIDAATDGEDGYTPGLYKATIEMDSFSIVLGVAWTQRGSVAIGDELLHDLQPLVGSDSDYVVTYSLDPNRIVTRRQNGLTWIDNAWQVNYNEDHANRVLACYGHLDDGDVVIGFESVATANTFRCVRFNVTDGLGAAAATSFTTLGDAEFYQAGFARYSSRECALVVDALNLDSNADAAEVMQLAYVRISGTSAIPTSNEHSCYHLRMLSRPWSYAGAREDDAQPNIYCVVGYNNCEDADEFTQRNAYVVNLACREWADQFSGGDHVVRPRVVSNLNQGTMDTQVAIWHPADPGGETSQRGRRCNHISNASLPPPYGPFRATRTMALPGFSKLMAMSRGGSNPTVLQPVASTVLPVVYHHEEPWVVRRDTQDPDPTVPDDNILLSYPWTVGDSLEVGRTLFFTGGSPAVFDGVQLVENGFPWAPEIRDVTETGIELQIPAGIYYYVATYEWRDAAGQLHRSAPSQVVTHDHTAGTVTVTVSTITCSQRDNTYWYPGANPIEIVLWRASDDGGGIFQRVYASQTATAYQIEDTPVNDPAEFQIDITDFVAESIIVRQEILPYQLAAGGGWTPLPPYCPPAFSCIAKWKNRVWAASAEDPRVLWYSQEILPEPGGVNSLPPEWNPSLTFRVDEVGRITALQSMDNTLVLFTDRGIYTITGEGADSTGQNPSLQLTQSSLGTGCIEPRSIVLTPVGIFFQSFKGLYLFSRTGSLEYLDFGANVEDVVMTGGNIRAATLLEDRHEVRFVTNSAVTGGPLLLIYDYQHDLWSTAPLASGDQPNGSNWMSSTAGGTQWRGTERDSLHVVLQQGAILVERAPTDAAAYQDQDRNSSDPIYLDVETERIQLDGIAGFQRIKFIGIVLDKPTASPVNVQLWYDVDGNVNELTEIVTFASPASPYLRIKPRIQKCTSFRLRIYETVGSPGTENIQITGIHVEVGIKKGIRKA